MGKVNTERVVYVGVVFAPGGVDCGRRQSGLGRPAVRRERFGPAAGARQTVAGAAGERAAVASAGSQNYRAAKLPSNQLSGADFR